MRRYLKAAAQISSLCGLLLASFCPPTSSQMVKAKNEPAVLQLTIQTDKTHYPKGSNVPVHVRVTNVSRRDVIVGRDMWTNASPSRVRLAITPSDGHSISGIQGAVDGASAFRGLSKAVLNWCILLPPGYSYESDTTLQSFVDGSGLTPGLYRVRAVFESAGIDADTYFNPLLDKPKDLEQLRDQDWKGVVGSNELTIRIVGSSQR
jgi:hypothetical protein